MSTKSERTKREQRIDRDRQARRRQRMREKRIPDTHAVHRAMAEAMSFAIAKLIADRTVPPDVRTFLDGWDQVARQILVDRESYDAAAATKAVRDQVKRRREHNSPYWIPSLQPEKQRDDI